MIVASTSRPKRRFGFSKVRPGTPGELPLQFRTRRFGMRAWQVTGFALGALILSVILSSSAYELVRNLALRSEQSADLRQAYVSASLVNAGLRTSTPNIVEILSGLEVPSGSTPFLFYDSKWYSTSLQAGRNVIPVDLRHIVSNKSPAFQRFILNSKVSMAVGIPLVASHSYYYEIFSFSDLERTLRLLTYSLALASALTTLAGAAMGLWTSRRLLAPLEEIANAASEIAKGDFETHLVTNDSDLLALASSFNSMVDALKNKIAQDARFASDVSHELRSPLTTIQNSLEIINHRKDEMAPRTRQAFEFLVDEIARFDRLVQDLLEIASSDSTSTNLVMEDLGTFELLENCFRSNRSSGFILDISAQLSGTRIYADKRRFERIIDNLVENASKYAGGLERVRALRVGDSLRLQFEDRGPGIPDHDKVRIFDRFARGSGRDRRMLGRGTGLGLSIVQEHVRTHRGRIWVEDRNEGGSIFVVELPLQVGQDVLWETTFETGASVDEVS